MTHEPECFATSPTNQRTPSVCICDRVREARKRAYLEGYNDHARTVQHWQDTHGAYRRQGDLKPCGCDASLYCSVCEPAKWKASQ